jgi:hypothetical protein
MTGPRAGFERRVQGALDAAPSRIPVVLGGCGTGRTWMLQHLRERAPRGTIQYVDVERCASTPERFLAAVTSSSPFPRHGDSPAPATARGAFDAAGPVSLDGPHPVPVCTAPEPSPHPTRGPFPIDDVSECYTFLRFRPSVTSEAPVPRTVPAQRSAP